MIISDTCNMYEFEPELVSPGHDSSVFYTIYYADIVSLCLHHRVIGIKPSAPKLKQRINKVTNDTYFGFNISLLTILFLIVYVYIFMYVYICVCVREYMRICVCIFVYVSVLR